MKPKRKTDNNIEQRETKHYSITRYRTFSLEDFLNFRESTNTLNVELFYKYLNEIKNKQKK